MVQEMGKSKTKVKVQPKKIIWIQTSKKTETREAKEVIKGQTQKEKICITRRKFEQKIFKKPEDVSNQNFGLNAWPPF